MRPRLRPRFPLYLPRFYRRPAAPAGARQQSPWPLHSPADTYPHQLLPQSPDASGTGLGLGDAHSQDEALERRGGKVSQPPTSSFPASVSQKTPPGRLSLSGSQTRLSLSSPPSRGPLSPSPPQAGSQSACARPGTAPVLTSGAFTGEDVRRLARGTWEPPGHQTWPRSIPGSPCLVPGSPETVWGSHGRKDPPLPGSRSLGPALP